MRPALLLAVALCAGCASGLERDLRAVNDAAKPGPGNCQDHVRRVAAALQGRYEVRGFYTRSRWYATGAHVSALVETPDGVYVLDNGSLRQGDDVERIAELERWWQRDFVAGLPRGTVGP